MDGSKPLKAIRKINFSVDGAKREQSTMAMDRRVAELIRAVKAHEGIRISDLLEQMVLAYADSKGYEVVLENTAAGKNKKAPT